MNRKNIVLWPLYLLVLFSLAGCGDSGGGGDKNTDTTGDTTGDTTSSYSISVTISGLTAGSTLVLQNNSADDLSLSADGSYRFSTAVGDGQSYTVAVKTQPTANEQYCNVINASGTISGADVDGVQVQCIDGLYNVIDTGQSKCYNSSTGQASGCNGTGYDADYNGTQPSYTLSADGTMVFDNHTGLIWTQTADTNGNGSIDVNDKYSQPDAASYCSSLTYGGYHWRLPGIKELYSLMDFTGGDPSGYNGTDTSTLTPFIDDGVFDVGFGDSNAGERIIDGQYATTSIYVSPEGTIFGAGTMFGVNFVDGRIKGYPYDMPPQNPKTFYVYCVTGNTEYGNNDFVDNADSTISDQATGLMWQQDDYQSSNFEDAVAHCESATTAGHSDWRLPNVKALHSIVDYSRSPDSSSSAAIDPLFNATSITNEAGQTDWGFYWASTTHATYTGDGCNAGYVSFGRALGYFESNVVDVHGAGAQRSNHKSDIAVQASGTADTGSGSFYYHGPQGDILRLNNMVRCVRDINAS